MLNTVRIQKCLDYAGVNVLSELIMGDNPAQQIIGYAHENSPNSIVMATHGYSTIGRWDYRSIANKVLYGVSSPVFLVIARQS